MDLSVAEMKLVFLTVCVFIGAGLSSPAQGKKIVCYYQSWAIYNGGDGAVTPEDFDASMCTHVNYAFIEVNKDGTLNPEDKNADIEQRLYYRINDMKKRNPNLKTLLSIGGASVSPKIFSRIAADPSKRAAMVVSARWYLEKYNFDGIDLDWEVPNGDDADNFIALLQDFRNDFDRNDWEVSAAVAATASNGYDVPRMNNILDHINLMTYDMYGPWSDYTGQNSPLYASSVESEWEKANLNMAASIQQWLDKGASPEKLIAGIAFYGRSFTLEDPDNQNGLHAPFSDPGEPGPINGEAGAITYLEWCEADDYWQCIWDDEQKNPYCIGGDDQWVGIDNERSIREKVAYINSKKLGGAMIWSIDQDDVNGSCGDNQPLLHTIYHNL